MTTTYRIMFESKAAGGARDETTFAVRGEIDGAPAGVWSTTVSGPEWQLEIRRPTGRDAESSEAAATRAAAEFVAAHARTALVELDPSADWQEWTVQHTTGDRASMARRAAELHAADALAPSAGDELDTFTA